VTENYNNLPLSFEANCGQTDANVKFLARGDGYNLFLTPTEAVISLRRPVADSSHSTFPGGHQKLKHLTARQARDVLRMELKGSNPAPQITGLFPQQGSINYFIGNDPNRWRTDVEHYGKVEYRSVYPGIDLIYYGHQRQLEYDWVVAPEADPSRIRLGFGGATSLRVDVDGELVVGISGGEVRHHKPMVYQMTNGIKQEVSGGYVIKGEREVGFEIATYDTQRPLVIDPVLSYSTYLGGSRDDFAGGAAIDAAGNIYVTGATISPDFPTSNALQSTFGGEGSDGFGDAFVVKLGPDGSKLIYSTFLGGNSDETATGIDVDTAGNVYVSGGTDSNNFPTMNPLQSAIAGAYDAFLTKLNPAGNAIVYSTYLGGKSLDFAIGLAVDSGGNAYVSGITNSTNFPTMNPFQPAYNGGTCGDASDTYPCFDNFVTKVNTAGAGLVFSTYVGGTGDDINTGIALDTAGQVYLTGGTTSVNYPTRNPVQAAFGGGDLDAFVTQMSSDGSSLVNSTLLGGSDDDISNSIAVDTSGNVHVAGSTYSVDFPTKNAIQPALAKGGGGDGWIAELQATGPFTLGYSTYFGGTGEDEIFSIAVDGAGNTYLSGSTSSTDFPVANAIQTSYQGHLARDAFVTKLNRTGSALIYSTYLGGKDEDDVAALKVDASGNAYVIGQTSSTDFPTKNAVQAVNKGSFDVFITKIGSDAVTVSAASYGPLVASKEIVAAFGPDLATTTVPASDKPLPTMLGGTTVRVTDSVGTERLAPLFFVSANQVNYEIPEGTATGAASVTITSGDGRVSSGVVQVVPAAPSLFTIDLSGSGAAIALDAFTFAGPPFTATQANGQPNVLAFYLTGVGPDATDLGVDVSASVQVRIDGNPATVLYAGPAPGFVGLNQLNVVLSPGITSGTHNVVVSRNAGSSNVATIAIK
jgi:uncharacterized protein (TIGR03437 family)